MNEGDWRDPKIPNKIELPLDIAISDLKKYKNYPDAYLYRKGLKKYAKDSHMVEPFSRQDIYKEAEEKRWTEAHPDFFARFARSPLGIGAVIPGLTVTAESMDWQKAALQHSIQGLMELTYNKKLPFALEDYDLNPLEEVLSGLYGLSFPLDAATMFAGGGFGGVAMKATVGGALTKTGIKSALTKNLLVKKGMQNKASKMAVQYGLDKKLVGSVLDHMAGSMGNFMVYEGVKGGFAASAKGENWIEGASHGVMHGAVLGSAMGLTGGLLGHANKQLMFMKNYKKGTYLGYGLGKRLSSQQKSTLRKLHSQNYFKNNTLGEIETRLAMSGPFAQYAAEVGTFTTVVVLQRWL